MKDAFTNIDFLENVRRSSDAVTENEINRRFRSLADGGLTGAIWRVSSCGRVMMRSKTWAPFSADCFKGKETMPFFHGRTPGDKVQELMDAYDPPAVAVRAARAAGQKIYLWVTVFDHQRWREALAFVDPFFASHPFYYVAARKGGYWTGIPSYAHPEARAHMIDLIRECAAYEPDGILLSTRSHSKWPWGWLGGRAVVPAIDLSKGGNIIDDFPAGDEFGYGFDDPVVEEYEKRHGVNIRAEDFDVEEWHRIKGEFFTQLLRAPRCPTSRRCTSSSSLIAIRRLANTIRASSAGRSGSTRIGKRGRPSVCWTDLSFTLIGTTPAISPPQSSSLSFATTASKYARG